MQNLFEAYNKRKHKFNTKIYNVVDRQWNELMGVLSFNLMKIKFGICNFKNINQLSLLNNGFFVHPFIRTHSIEKRFYQPK